MFNNLVLKAVLVGSCVMASSFAHASGFQPQPCIRNPVTNTIGCDPFPKPKATTESCPVSASDANSAAYAAAQSLAAYLSQEGGYVTSSSSSWVEAADGESCTYEIDHQYTGLPPEGL